MIVKELDLLIGEKILPLRERIIEVLSQKHPQLFSMINGMMAGKENKVGMQVSENGQIIGNYTFYLNGIHISRFESDNLSSEISHPLFGTIKPYAIIEKRVLEKMLDDEETFKNDLFSTIPQYLPECTIKFMK